MLPRKHKSLLHFITENVLNFLSAQRRNCFAFSSVQKRVVLCCEKLSFVVLRESICKLSFKSIVNTIELFGNIKREKKGRSSCDWQVDVKTILNLDCGLCQKKRFLRMLKSFDFWKWLLISFFIALYCVLKLCSLTNSLFCSQVNCDCSECLTASIIDWIRTKV